MKKNVMACYVIALLQQCCLGQSGGGGGGPVGRAQVGPPVTATGTVFDPSGAPSPNVPITIWRTSGRISVTNADTDGNYSIHWRSSVAQGNAVVLIARDPAHNLVAANDLTGTNIHLDIHLAEGLELSGSVLDPAGKPLTNFQVRLIGQINNNNPHIALDQTMTDAQGSFRFTALPQEKEYTLVVNIPDSGMTTGGYGSALGTLAVKDAQTNSYIFPAFVLGKADRKIAGYVLNGSNQPLAGATLSVSGVGQPVMLNATTDEKGHFALDELCDGLLKMSYFNRGKPPAIRPSFVELSAINGQGIHAGDTNLVLTFGVKQPDANAH